MTRAARRPRAPDDVTTISRRGQTVVPARLRERLGLREGSRLRWLEGVGALVVVPEPDDPVEELAGRYRGRGALRRLLAERRRERARERR